MKYLVSAIVACTALLLVLIMTLVSQQTDTQVQKNNVNIVDGIQIIDLTAKGGYSPIKTSATANMPTKLKIETNGTFDCSSSVFIPELSVSEQLPTSGITEIDLGNPTVGILKGTCGMGMYRFEIDFQG